MNAFVLFKTGTHATRAKNEAASLTMTNESLARGRGRSTESDEKMIRRSDARFHGISSIEANVREAIDRKKRVILCKL